MIKIQNSNLKSQNDNNRCETTNYAKTTNNPNV